MSTFDSTKTELSDLLDDIMEGKLQLPDFQRGWVWDDEHIRSLLVSIARSFPIGAIMLLETGGDTRFQIRFVEGVPHNGDRHAETLILDGQQRLTSLIQVLKLSSPVTTRDEKKRSINRYYYFNIEKALEGSDSLTDAIITVDENRKLWKNFGRDIELDLSTPEKEYETFHFPCNQILNYNKWEYGLLNYDLTRLNRYMKFREEIMDTFRSYLIPVIVLKKETSKEAVCLVFEKVNTGGVPLTVFELVTATYSADGFNLRKDWYGSENEKGRQSQLAEKPLLREIQPTDFLQGISLLNTYKKRQNELNNHIPPREATPVSAKKEHILIMPLEAYNTWKIPLTDGFLEMEQFLRHLGLYHTKYLPYRSQLVPLATVLTIIKDRWLEPQVQEKLVRWYWCGVFGELYGSAVETRIALDFQNLMDWIGGGNDEPSTVIAAGFQSNRLDTLRTRTSAAYRGLYVLLQQQGAKDLFWKARMIDLDRNEKGIEIHHIFPRKWCEDHNITPKMYNSIINKTAISYKANRKIGGNAPSNYLQQIQNDSSVQINDSQMDEILRTHLIEPEFLRNDDFDGFYQARKTALLSMIESAMGKQAIQGNEPVADDSEADDTEEI